VTSGRPVNIPMTESEPYHSVGQYGWNKAAIEEHLLKLHADEGVPVTIMRPSHSYGEGGGILRPFGPWESFVARLRAGRKLIVPGDGTGLWAACHVDDVAQGFLATFGNPKAFGEVFHITGDEWHTWDQYHQAVADVVGGTYSPVYMPSDVLAKCAPKWSGGLREIFQWTSVFNNDKLKALGYPGQTISFAEGTKRTLAWMERDGRLADIEGEDFEDKLIAAWEHATAELPVMPKPD
jgi:nucleoside-diphosphate-sugar epimerase